MELKSKATAVESKKQEFLINDKDIEMSSNVDIPRYILKFVSSVAFLLLGSLHQDTSSKSSIMLWENTWIAWRQNALK